MEMFDEIQTVRMVNGKPFISDEDQVAELDFAEACDAFILAEKRFCKLNAVVRCDQSADVCKWFDALEERYQTEKRMWELFTGNYRNPQTGRLYLEFREALIAGKRLRADA